VLDVGCGTGIAARQFQAAGCTVLAGCRALGTHPLPVPVVRKSAPAGGAAGL